MKRLFCLPALLLLTAAAPPPSPPPQLPRPDWKDLERAFPAPAVPPAVRRSAAMRAARGLPGRPARGPAAARPAAAAAAPQFVVDLAQAGMQPGVDCHDLIQSQINACLANKAVTQGAGVVLKLPPGANYCSYPLIVDADSVTVRGDGANVCWLRFPGCQGFITGLRRSDFGGLTDDHFVPLAGVLDGTQPPARVGFASRGNSCLSFPEHPVAFGSAALDAQGGQALAFTEWDGLPGWTLSMALDLQGSYPCLFSLGPWSSPGPVWVGAVPSGRPGFTDLAVLYRQKGDSWRQTDFQVRRADAMVPGSGLVRLDVVFDHRANQLTCRVNRQTVPMTGKTQLAGGFMPTRGEWPALVGSDGQGGIPVGGPLASWALYGMKVVANAAPPPPNDAWYFDATTPGTVMVYSGIKGAPWLPSGGEPRLIRTDLGPASGRSGCTYGWAFSTQGPGNFQWVSGFTLQGVRTVDADTSVLLGSAGSVTVRECSIPGIVSSLGSAHYACSYPVTVEDSLVGGADRAVSLYMADRAYLKNVGAVSGGRSFARFNGCSVVCDNVQLSFGSSVRRNTFEILDEMYGGTYIFNSVEDDNENGALPECVLYARKIPFQTTFVNINSFAVAGLAPGAPALLLDAQESAANPGQGYVVAAGLQAPGASGPAVSASGHWWGTADVTLLGAKSVANAAGAAVNAVGLGASPAPGR